MIATPTCAVSPAQNSPCRLAQIDRRTGIVRQVRVRKWRFYPYRVYQSGDCLGPHQRTLGGVRITEGSDFSWNRTRSPPSDQPGRLHGVLSICIEFWRRLQRNRGQHREQEISPVCCIVVLSLSFQLCVRHEQVINVIPLMGKSPLTSNAECLVGFTVKAPMLCPNRILRSLDHSHKFPKHQGRI